ncbi:hypothetical protein J2Y40_003045 [Chryseobacterium sp. 2987]|nr:hypothetical protein [Chryseobacterium sp. 2987]
MAMVILFFYLHSSIIANKETRTVIQHYKKYLWLKMLVWKDIIPAWHDQTKKYFLIQLHSALKYTLIPCLCAIPF